jgi:hypothetical protein
MEERETVDSSDIVGGGPRAEATSASVQLTSVSVSAPLEDPTSEEMRHLFAHLFTHLSVHSHTSVFHSHIHLVTFTSVN